MSAVAARSSVVEEIAERRRADLGRRALPSRGRRSGGGRDPRRARSSARLARAGAAHHRGAETVLAVGRPDRRRRRSISSTRARAYEAGGAAAISVLCEPHWFNGSVDDLRRVREAVGVPVLAKEFMVDLRQLPLVRAAGADAVLLLAVLHPEARLAEVVRRAFELGLEPLVEAHDHRRARGRAGDTTRGSSASTTATSGRSRSTRNVPTGSDRSCPTTGSSSPSRACATRRRSSAGEPSRSTARSSARR